MSQTGQQEVDLADEGQHQMPVDPTKEVRIENQNIRIFIKFRKLYLSNKYSSSVFNSTNQLSYFF